MPESLIFVCECCGLNKVSENSASRCSFCGRRTCPTCYNPWRGECKVCAKESKEEMTAAEGFGVWIIVSTLLIVSLVFFCLGVYSVFFK